MQIFIISIEEENSSRLKKFLSQPFFKDDLPAYTKIGVKGGALTAKQYFELAVKGRSNPLTPGELGCTLSHLNALQQFLDTEDKYALILEDDAILRNDFTYKKLLRELNNIDLPQNLLLSIGGIQMKLCRKIRGKYCSFELFNKKILEIAPDFYHRVNYTVSYIVDRQMAETLLAYHQPIRRTDDWSYLYDFDCSVKLFMTYLVDHPVIEKGEINQELSLIEHERVASLDILKSKYGTNFRRNLAKLMNEKYMI